jgi:hypothetical protein
MDKACSVELLQGGSYEPLAEAIHEVWRAQQISEGKPATLWQDLAETLKQSNRDQARDIVAKLTSIGCGLSPLRDWDARDFEFTAQELEQLAIDEHDRWERERRADHWVSIPMPVGATEDDTQRLLKEAKDRKESPYLIPWPDLVEKYPDIAEYDRIFVRDIPQFVAGVGLQVIRTGTPDTLTH